MSLTLSSGSAIGGPHGLDRISPAQLGWFFKKKTDMGAIVDVNCVACLRARFLDLGYLGCHIAKYRNQRVFLLSLDGL